MRWWQWVLLCVALACGGEKRSAADACFKAGKALDEKNGEATDPSAQAQCEAAWQRKHDVRIAVAGAKIALAAQDDQTLKQWAERVPPTVEGARVLHFWGQLQRQRGDLKGAEATLRRTLELRVNGDPGRATNTALMLIEIVRSSHSAEETVALARVAWEQAGLAAHPESSAYAALTLVQIFLELGELHTAEAIAGQMQATGEFASHRELSQARLHAVRGNQQLAVAHFTRCMAAFERADNYELYVDAAPELIGLQLELGRIPDARRTFDRATAFANQYGSRSIDEECRLAAAEALLLVAEGHAPGALAAVERGLATKSRDGARVALLNTLGDLRSKSGDARSAELAWREAADMLETWRMSIPTVQLRAGLIGQHRRTLESWLDSTAARGDVDGALEVTRRLIGRSLLDRIGQREANATTVDASIRDVEKRLATHRELGVTLGSVRDLRNAPHDVVVVMSGARSVWAMQSGSNQWSVRRVGERAEIARLVDAYMKNLADARTASRLGEALFPVASLPKPGAPIAAVLDRDFADLPLAALRSGNRYLIEHAPIVELLVPDLLFEPLAERAWTSPVAIGDPNGDLPGAARETRSVASLVSATPYVGVQATLAAIRAAAAARVLHVATHANVSEGQTVLALHGATLSSLDVVNMKLAPRLAVIATCRSQVNDDPSTSLVAAFLAAGSSGVVGAKRALDDSATAPLIEAFYRHGGAEQPITALALAQRAAIAARRQPHTWAALSFFGVGGWLTIPKG